MWQAFKDEQSDETFGLMIYPMVLVRKCVAQSMLELNQGSAFGYQVFWSRSQVGSSSVVTPILGCNMAILDAIWINCIYIWSWICGCIWNGAIGFCILVDVVLQYGGFAMHIEKLAQPRCRCKHGYCDQQNGCMSYSCNEKHGSNTTVLPRANLSQNSFITTPQLRGNMAILP